ncbi:MAG: phosphoribosylglycinamide formyltransferase [Thermodesulfobacteriota bacterium]|nr:MAG: phosphoribosylglycinamide formyltransferase [Thermodesulfobacteriota bacterium]
MDKMRVAIFASGSGTNLQAIIDAQIKTIEIVLVFSNKSDAYAIERAKNHNLAVEVIDHKYFESREDFDSEIIRLLEPYNLDLIILAGYMRILSPVLVRAYKGKIINIHPALLPSFPGINSTRQALEYGVKYTGVTVHFVDEGVDTGPIILQSIVEIEDRDTEESVLEKIHKVEHQIYPEAIALVSSDQIELKGRRVVKKS